MDTDFVLDEIISPDEYPNSQDSRQQDGQAAKKITFETAGQAHIFNNIPLLLSVCKNVDFGSQTRFQRKM
jgi:hypothetical protein